MISDLEQCPITALKIRGLICDGRRDPEGTFDKSKPGLPAPDFSHHRASYHQKAHVVDLEGYSDPLELQHRSLR